MNIPYVKKYDENGELTNPINGVYVSSFPNRQARARRKERFLNNSKGCNLVVTKTMKYKKVLQEVIKEGKVVKIEHYILS